MSIWCRGFGHATPRRCEPGRPRPRRWFSQLMAGADLHVLCSECYKLGMRRHLATAIIFLGLGAMANVMVAWSCVEFAKRCNFDARVTARMRQESWDASGDHASSITVNSVFIGAGTDLAIIIERVKNSASSRNMFGSGTEIHEFRAGWPTRSFVGNDRRAIDPQSMYGLLTPSRRSMLLNRPLTLTFDIPGITMPASGPLTVKRLLPLDPMPWGFLINSIFFGALIWLGCLVCRLVRGAFRAIHHRCRHCGYPVGVSPVCTECGRRVKVRPQSTLPVANARKSD